MNGGNGAKWDRVEVRGLYRRHRGVKELKPSVSLRLYAIEVCGLPCWELLVAEDYECHEGQPEKNGRRKDKKRRSIKGWQMPILAMKNRRPD